MNPSPLLNKMYEDLVGLCMWMQDPETTVEELTTELIERSSSSRAERLKVYEELIKKNQTTYFESMIMEINYCTYIGQLRDEINSRTCT